jgi:calcineurin-like phosphoesterase family protein
MAKRWITSDWHLGDNRFEILNRPFTSAAESILRLTKEHNALVAPDDLVVVVGDVCYNKAPDYLPFISQFNGRKILIRGNHDRVFSDKQLSKYFTEIVPDGEGVEITDLGFPVYATHYPSCGRPDMFNLVGHVHGAWRVQLNALNIGVDCNHFRPYDLDKISFHFKAIEEFYDSDIWAAYLTTNEAFKGIRGLPSSYSKEKKT